MHGIFCCLTINQSTVNSLIIYSTLLSNKIRFYKENGPADDSCDFSNAVRYFIKFLLSSPAVLQIMALLQTFLKLRESVQSASRTWSCAQVKVGSKRCQHTVPKDTCNWQLLDDCFGTCFSLGQRDHKVPVTLE